MARVLGEGTGAEQAAVWLDVGESGFRPAAILAAGLGPPAKVPEDAVEVARPATSSEPCPSGCRRTIR